MNISHVFVIGYPSFVGGAGTELWHTLRLWRCFGLGIRLVPTWHVNQEWAQRISDLGIATHQLSGPDQLADVPELPGSIVVSFCNASFLPVASTLKNLGCRLVWANFKTRVLKEEVAHYRECGPFDAYVFQTSFQFDSLWPTLMRFGARRDRCYQICGAFCPDDFPFEPRPRLSNEPLVVGQLARPAAENWHSDPLNVFLAVRLPEIEARVMGWDDRLTKKYGPPLTYVTALPSNSKCSRDFLAKLHCLVPINDGAWENWPRVGLEAMAAGVPVVTENTWGWREIIEHGVTGYLCDDTDEIVRHIQSLGTDEYIRQRIALNARERVLERHADQSSVWQEWQRVFATIAE